jgi:hypothetical protein
VLPILCLQIWYVDNIYLYIDFGVLHKFAFQALRECAAVMPVPLYREMIYLYGRRGNNQMALELLLTKVGDAKQVIEFVEVCRFFSFFVVVVFF